jgi:hypothetical protein
MSTLLIIFIFVGIFLCPVFTLGIVLLHFGFNVLGFIAVSISLISIILKSSK